MFTRFIVLSCLLVVAIYLFVTAPAPLPDIESQPRRVPILSAFSVLAAENNVVRALWTDEIVAKGKPVGLAFDEDWKEGEIEAGPLPALFLRETATRLEDHHLPLGLFLGSDAPVRQSNSFKGEQLKRLELLRSDGEPQFFFEPDIALHTAMFPDYAVTQACVDCHNEHPDSPRNDWKLGDVMGATTWTYPKASVSVVELLEMTAALRQAAKATYQEYLDHTSSFEAPPVIGGAWPSDGYCLPSADEFMEEVEVRTSTDTLAALMLLGESGR